MIRPDRAFPSGRAGPAARNIPQGLFCEGEVIMPIFLTCDCGKRLSVPEELAGKQVRCPGCKTILPVPAAKSAPLQPTAVTAQPPARSPVQKVAAGQPPRPAREEELEDEERPARRRRKREDELEEEPRVRCPARKPPGRQLFLRITILILAQIGSGLAGALGVMSFSNTHDAEQIALVERMRARVAEEEKARPDDPWVQKERAEVERFDKNRVLCWILLAACLLGLTGAVLAFVRKGKFASPLMIVPGAGGGVIFAPSLIFTSPLLLAGLLDLLVRSAPRRPPTEGDLED
jgi:hypothetical protein